eukprot:998966_1
MASTRAGESTQHLVSTYVEGPAQPMSYNATGQGTNSATCATQPLTTSYIGTSSQQQTATRTGEERTHPRVSTYVGGRATTQSQMSTGQDIAHPLMSTYVGCATEPLMPTSVGCPT